MTPVLGTVSECCIAEQAETASHPDSSCNTTLNVNMKNLKCGFKPPEGNTELTYDQRHWATIVSSSRAQKRACSKAYDTNSPLRCAV